MDQLAIIVFSFKVLICESLFVINPDRAKDQAMVLTANVCQSAITPVGLFLSFSLFRKRVKKWPKTFWGEGGVIRRGPSLACLLIPYKTWLGLLYQNFYSALNQGKHFPRSCLFFPFLNNTRRVFSWVDEGEKKKEFKNVRGETAGY